MLPILANFAPIIATSLDQSENQYEIEHLHNMSTSPYSLVKISLVVSEISLLQAIIKKRKKKESNRSIT